LFFCDPLLLVFLFDINFSLTQRLVNPLILPHSLVRIAPFPWRPFVLFFCWNTMSSRTPSLGTGLLSFLVFHTSITTARFILIYESAADLGHGPHATLRPLA